jgi:tryptophan-rich sensory protein
MLPDMPLLFAIAWTLAVLGAGGMVTRPDGSWYRLLVKPAWQPPDWAFAPAWTLIFLCASAAFVAAWRAAGSGAEQAALAAVYVVNGGLNFLWSLLFFGRKRPDAALLEIFPLWLSVAAMMLVVSRTAPGWSLLLVPYLAWVTFAAILNRAIVRLNRPLSER